MSKRGMNEGSIYRRNDGRWVAVVDLGWREGKRKRKTFYGRTRKDVQEKLSAALRDLQQGLPVASDRQNVGQFLDRWLEETKRATLRPKTFASYKQIMRLYIKPSIGRIPLIKLTPQDVQSLVNRRLADGLAPRTVEYTHAILRSALVINDNVICRSTTN